MIIGHSSMHDDLLPTLLSTYGDSFEADGGLRWARDPGHLDGGGELRDVVPGVALADDEEVAALVFGEPVQPPEQELQRVARGHVVAHHLVHPRVRGVREAHAHGALQVQHVRVCTSPSPSLVSERNANTKEDRPVPLCVCVQALITGVPGVLVLAEGLAVRVHAERADLLERSDPKRRTARPCVRKRQINKTPSE